MSERYPVKFGEISIPSSPFQTASYRALAAPVLPQGSSIQTYRTDLDGKSLDLPSVTIQPAKARVDQVGNVTIVP